MNYPRPTTEENTVLRASLSTDDFKFDLEPDAVTEAVTIKIHSYQKNPSWGSRAVLILFNLGLWKFINSGFAFGRYSCSI